MTQIVSVKGQDFTVELDSHFRLSTTVKGDTVTARDVEELKVAISRRLRSQNQERNIAIVILDDFETLYGELATRYVRAVLRGKDQRNRRALLTINGKKVSSDYPTIVARGERVSDDDLKDLNERRANLVAAQKHLDAKLRQLTNARLSVDSLLEEADDGER